MRGFVVSVLLFAVGGAFAIGEAIRSFLHGGAHEHGPGRWAYGVLLGGFVFEAVSFAVALRALGKARGGRSLRAYWEDNRDPTLPTVLLEDSAALVSLVIAATGLAASQITGNGLWDGVASLMIGLILIGVAICLAFENYSPLIGEAAPADVEARIRRTVEREDGVERIDTLHTLHLGPHAILVALSLRFSASLSTPQIETIVARLHARIKAALAGATDARLIVIQPSPGLTGPAAAQHLEATLQSEP